MYGAQNYNQAYDRNYNYLVTIKIFFTSNRTIINRKLGKLDEMLSYVGGLFAIIIGFFGFFLNSYNEYKYELNVAGSTFTMKNRKRQVS